MADDVIVYGGSSSHRVLPSTFGQTNSNNSEVALGFEARNRLNLNAENRALDYDERAVYHEALQVSLIIYAYMLLASCPANIWCAESSGNLNTFGLIISSSLEVTSMAVSIQCNHCSP